MNKKTAKITKILVLLSLPVLLLHSIHDLGSIVTIPLAIFLPLIFFALNVLVRELDKADQRTPSWIHLSFIFLILSIWSAFIFSPHAGVEKNPETWFIFGITISASETSPAAISFLQSISAISAFAIFLSIFLFIIVTLIYIMASIRKDGEVKKNQSKNLTSETPVNQPPNEENESLGSR